MAIHLQSVRVHFGGIEVLRSITLKIEAGERVAILGPSGAGKSTLLRLLNGSVRPSEGDVYVLGRRIDQLGPRRLRGVRRETGTISQSLDLAGPLRVVHNVNAARLGAWSTARALVSLVSPRGATEVANALESVGLAGFEDRRTDQLSGGEQQRVAVARVLCQQPRLILGDEPTASLDPEWSHRILALLTSRDNESRNPAIGRPPAGAALKRDDRTVVLSLHSPDDARAFADRIVGIRAGKVCLDRPASAVSDDDLVALYAQPSASS